ncbi:hypothetical protein OQA88_8493 [Cercophora sp. LCS_1]
MAQQSSRSEFDRLLAKTHVEHALIQSSGRHNDVPTALATAFFLSATPAQLQAVYESASASLEAWATSPRPIASLEDRTIVLGDVRYQRAYMTYFSMQNNLHRGNSMPMALSELLCGTKPLIYGLFSGLGRPLVFLSDAVELSSAMMVVQALTLSAADWIDWIHDVLSHPQLAIPKSNPLPPGEILSRVRHDGRLSGIMKSGPGFHELSQVFTNPNAKATLLEYVHELDYRDPDRLLRQFSSLSALLACATHKPGKPEFDYYLNCVPTWVNSLRVLLPIFQERADQVRLLRGVWLLILLVYITQLRPIMDETLLAPMEYGNEELELSFVPSPQEGATGWPYRDLHLFRTLRSIKTLGVCYDGAGVAKYNLRAASKLARQWRRWTGLGMDGEESLNIRL